MTCHLTYADRPAGVVYLLHFERPISDKHTCRHYLGFSRRQDFGARIEEHRSGRGARLTQVARERGIGFVLARVWYGDRTFERKLKKRKAAPRLCPICTGACRLSAIDDLI